MSDGGSFATKDLISGGGSIPTPVAVSVVVPTAANVVLMASENIIDNLRVRQSASLTLPSLYKRAYMITREVDEFALVKVR